MKLHCGDMCGICVAIRSGKKCISQKTVIYLYENVTSPQNRTIRCDLNTQNYQSRCMCDILWRAVWERKTHISTQNQLFNDLGCQRQICQKRVSVMFKDQTWYTNPCFDKLDILKIYLCSIPMGKCPFCNTLNTIITKSQFMQINSYFLVSPVAVL